MDLVGCLWFLQSGPSNVALSPDMHLSFRCKTVFCPNVLVQLSLLTGIGLLMQARKATKGRSRQQVKTSAVFDYCSTARGNTVSAWLQ